jgi:hypothetical protein
MMKGGEKKAAGSKTMVFPLPSFRFGKRGKEGKDNRLIFQTIE